MPPPSHSVIQDSTQSKAYIIAGGEHAQNSTSTCWLAYLDTCSGTLGQAGLPTCFPTYSPTCRLHAGLPTCCFPTYYLLHTLILKCSAPTAMASNKKKKKKSLLQGSNRQPPPQHSTRHTSHVSMGGRNQIILVCINMVVLRERKLYTVFLIISSFFFGHRGNRTTYLPRTATPSYNWPSFPLHHHIT